MAQKSARRRGRAPHIGSSSARGKAETFDPTDEDWRRIECAYGETLSTGERSKVIEIVDAYFFWAPFEEGAVKAADVKRWVERIAKAAANLSKQLHALFDTGMASKTAASSTQDIAEAARLLIERSPRTNLPESELSKADEPMRARDAQAAAKILRDAHQSYGARGVKIENHLTHLAELSAACERALEHLDATISGRQGFDVGDAWKEMILELRVWAQTSGKPHRVSTNRERPKPMPFVRFIAALQACFPDGCARHSHSEWSLADAIYGVVHRREGLSSQHRKNNP